MVAGLLLPVLLLAATSGVVLALPIVDPGLFVIMGVRTCRLGLGYCLLGRDCTLDEDFLPDDEGGHCDGLRSAFTPSAHFICCRYDNGSAPAAAEEPGGDKTTRGVAHEVTTELADEAATTGAVDKDSLEHRQTLPQDSDVLNLPSDPPQQGAIPSETLPHVIEPRDATTTSGKSAGGGNDEAEKPRKKFVDETLPMEENEVIGEKLALSPSPTSSDKSKKSADEAKEMSNYVADVKDVSGEDRGTEANTTASELWEGLPTDWTTNTVPGTTSYPPPRNENYSTIQTGEAGFTEETGGMITSVDVPGDAGVTTSTAAPGAGQLVEGPASTELSRPTQRSSAPASVLSTTESSYSTTRQAVSVAVVSTSAAPPGAIISSSTTNPTRNSSITTPTTTSSSSITSPTSNSTTTTPTTISSTTTPTTSSSTITSSSTTPTSTKTSTTTTTSSSSTSTTTSSTTTTTAKPWRCDGNQRNLCWMVVLVDSRDGKPLCRGTFLNADTVITSAKCVISRLFSCGLEHVKLRGDAGRVSSAQIKDVLVHEDYDIEGPMAVLNDLGMVRLHPGEPLAQECALCLPHVEEDFRGRKCCSPAANTSLGRPSGKQLDSHAFSDCGSGAGTQTPQDSRHRRELQSGTEMAGSALLCGSVLAGVASMTQAGAIFTPTTDHLTWIRANMA